MDIGIDDFELEHLKNSQQISKEDFEKYKLTQTLKELAGTVKNKEKWE